MAKWKFEQTVAGGSKGPAKTLELDDYAAPFGRPRRSPVAKELIRSRVQTTYYPGSSLVNRTVFGANWEPIELTGRWMTRYLPGATNAGDMADRFTEFLLDERPILISWGNIVSYNGYMEELELSRESEDEIAWRIKLLVDKRVDFQARPPGPDPQPLVVMRELTDFAISVAKIPNVPDVKPDFLASLDALVGQLNKVSAEMNKLADQIDSIEKAAFSTLQHLRAAVSGMMTAIIKIRETISNVSIDSENLSRSLDSDVRTAQVIAGSVLGEDSGDSGTGGNAASDINWLAFKNDFDVKSTAAVAKLVSLDRQLELTGTGDITRSTVAKEGDTWESIATRAGGLNLVTKIRELNGVQYGEKPVPGELYLLP